MQNEIYTGQDLKLFDAEAVALSASATSVAMDLSTYKPAGVFSVQIEVTGDGTVTLAYEVSVNGVDFVVPTGASEIVTGFTKTGGVAAGGKDLIAFYPEPCRFLRLKVTETAGANAIAINAWLCIQ
jgi:hypothetical protein